MTAPKEAAEKLREANIAARLRQLHAEYYSGAGLKHAEGFEFRALILEAAAVLENRPTLLAEELRERVEELESAKAEAEMYKDLLARRGEQIDEMAALEAKALCGVTEFENRSLRRIVDLHVELERLLTWELGREVY